MSRTPVQVRQGSPKPEQTVERKLRPMHEVVEPQRGIDVGDAFAGRAGDRRVGVVVVQAVAPLVVEHAGDLTGVGKQPPPER